MKAKSGKFNIVATSEKLQKVIASSGKCSRREAERWIALGRVRVNGKRANIGLRVIPEDRIEVDGELLKRSQRAFPRVLLMNKDTGVEVSQNPSTEAKSAFADLPGLREGRWMNVGRLDINTSGLLLFTNDGELAFKLSHPSSALDREYAVRVRGELDLDQIETLKSGVEINGAIQRFTDIRYFDGSGTNHWYHVVLMEGRNKEVRNLFASQQLLVSRLKRVRFGPVFLPSWVQRGKILELDQRDVKTLCSSLGYRTTKPVSTERRAKDYRTVLMRQPI